MAIFKACDIRGVYGRDLTEKEAYQIGWAIGITLERRRGARDTKIIVGGDVRISTPSLKAALMDGLVERGMRVVDIGVVPTPVFYFATRKLNVANGVMVTASHNPPDFNGMKIVLGELPVTESELEEIGQLCAESPPQQSHKEGLSEQVEQIEVIADYKRSLHEIAGQQSLCPRCDLSVVVDCGNGCYSQIAPDCFRSFGYKVTELFCIPDGSFPNRPPNSAVAADLLELREKVVRERAHLGVAFDGDGDRVSFVDDRGRTLSSDKAAVIFLNKLLARGKGAPKVKVVHDVKSSKIVSETAEKLDAKPLMERSGHAFIRTRMIREQAIFGAEVSGHFFYRHFDGGDDGLYSSLSMAQIVSESGRRLSELADEIPSYCTTPDIRVPFEGDETVLDEIADAFKNEEVSRLDGVRIEFADGWGLARKSVTEPVLTLRFEAKTEADLENVMRRFLSPTPQLSETVFRYIRNESEKVGK